MWKWKSLSVTLWGPILWADSLPAQPQGKPKNIEVGSLSLLQWIFPYPGMEPRSPALQLQVDSLPTELSGKPGIVDQLKQLSWALNDQPVLI